jgi:hypothetical protein
MRPLVAVTTYTTHLGLLYMSLLLVGYICYRYHITEYKEDLSYLFRGELVPARVRWVGVRSVQLTYPMGHFVHYATLLVLSPGVFVLSLVIAMPTFALVFLIWLFVAANIAALATVMLIFAAITGLIYSAIWLVQRAVRAHATGSVGAWSTQCKRNA